MVNVGKNNLLDALDLAVVVTEIIEEWDSNDIGARDFVNEIIEFWTRNGLLITNEESYEIRNARRRLGR